MKKEIFSLNLLKGICAILVVLIHTHLTGKIAIVPFYRCAVPIFYMISGYFLMNENGLWHREKIKGYLRKMVSIWFIIDVIYILFSSTLFKGYSPFHGTNLDTYKVLKIFSSEIFFGGQFCLPLWYITAYVWTLVIIYFWRKSISSAVYLSIIIGLLCLNLVLGSYDFVLPFQPWQPFSNINVFTTALPFVMLGGFAKLHLNKLQQFTSNKIYLLLIGLSYVEVAILWLLGSKDGDVFIMTPLLSLMIFVDFILHPTWGKNAYLTLVGRKFSLNIYLLHYLMIWVVGSICQYLQINIRSIEFLIVLPITFLLCYLIGYTKSITNRLSGTCGGGKIGYDYLNLLPRIENFPNNSLFIYMLWVHPNPRKISLD